MKATPAQSKSDCLFMSAIIAKSRLFAFIFFVVVSIPSACRAADPLGSVYSETSATARQLMLRGEMHLRSGANDLAIIELKKALQQDPDDVDIHCLYAEALQRKLEGLPDKGANMPLLVECSEEWLKIMRCDVGEDKDARLLGLSVSGLLMRDEYRAMLAKRRLQQLTGLVPKPWETNSRFLGRVVKRFEKSVKGKLVVRQ